MSQGPQLSILFLNHNRLSETRQTVTHLRRLLTGREEIEVIAVDNASDDGTSAYLQGQAHWMRVMILEKNGGIAGLNQGFRQASGEYILVLDDDSHPYDIATVDRMIACLNKRPEVGVVACRIESAKGEPVRTWHLPETDIPGPSMTFVGCGFAIRRDLFERIGWYPERFFLYQNEMEVAIRVMRQGYDIRYEPNCRIVHRESPMGRTHWRRVFFPTRNTIWIIRRYFPFPGAMWLIASRLCIGFVRAIQSGELGWYAKAVREAFKEPIEPEPLPQAMRDRLEPFRKQNSLWHQFKAASCKL